MIKDFSGTAAAAGQQVSHGGGSLPTVTATAGAAPDDQDAQGQPAEEPDHQDPDQGHRPDGGSRATRSWSSTSARSGATATCSTRPGSGAQPFGFTIGASPSQVIPGWDKGLVGQTVGSRVMLVIPPADGYGKTGSPQAHIKGTDTLVFVVDILGAFGAAQG